MSATVKSAGRPAAHRLHLTAAFLVLSVGNAIGEARYDRLFADLEQIADSTPRGKAAGRMALDVDPISGVAGQEIPIRITLPDAASLASGETLQAFILVRNIPDGVRLTTGMASGRLWVLALKDLRDLRLLAQPGSASSFTLEFNLIGPNNRRLAQQNVSVDLASPNAATPMPTVGALAKPEELSSEQRPARTVRPVRRLPPEEEAVLLEKGRELVRQGGIAAARIIFEELAQKGSAQGALDLARSYDPAYIPDPRISAISPDVTKALTWYRRAEELGSEEARARLAEIVPTR